MDYHIGRNGQQLGKFTEDQIRAGLLNGDFLATDLAWTDGMGTWQPLGSLPQFQNPAPAATPAEGQDVPSPEASAAVVPLSPVEVLPPVAPMTSQLATVSLVCGIVAVPAIFCCCSWILFSPAAIICGHLALSEIKMKPHLASSRGIAKAGLILGYVTLAIAVLMQILFLIFHISLTTFGRFMR